ncbi:glucose dehydrogenase [FAD, quinone]-like [Diaphorina citri]|uniref:Glucose dehydrogenase [FAD, quinone]-like n=1 Tax=Diaphorina citri TaxID=121845 RepID=A0A1S3DP53_DIACI|nr:glucose dehydrogenase [FAD, quinone]-like [Diaphorina citri]
MLSTLAKLTLIVLICHVHWTHNILLESVYQKYLRQQGLEFRENIFLGNKPILSEYDFVIIGGGVGGSVVANRLSENPKWKVLLLESGEDENIYTNIPLLAHFNSLTHFNWGYKLEKNEEHPQCLGMYNDQCPCPRGKGLGGSSILNYMIYTRGNKKDYDTYEAAGNKGWGYDSVLKYFLKSENNTSEFLDADIHSREGPLKVTNIPYQNLLTEKFTQATCELGYRIYDYTGIEPATEGFSKLQSTLSKGQRYSANRAYLKSVKKRTSKNLHISIFSHVTRILVDPKTKRAHGVEFQKNGVKRIVLAKKEVILSAGAIGSPQILMLSGIGPEEHLREFDINVVSNLKGVGQNLNDHHSFFGITFLMNRTNTGSTIEKKVLNIDQFLKWLKLGRGPLSAPGGVTGIGYLNTKNNTDKSYPDTEYLFTIGSFNSDAGRILRKSMNIRKDVYDSIYGNINNRESWSIIPVVLRPKTRGSIKLKSKNPFKYPKLYYDFFQYEEDADVMLEAIKNVIKISETEAFQSIGSQIHKTPIRDCAHFEFGCDDYWRCAMKYFTSSLYHQSGTCKMGPQSDPDAVVNDQLQVYGVTNLRVVDASIFPIVPSAHLYAPTVMVGEKASDMIKETWKNYNENEPHKNSGCYSHPNTIDQGYGLEKPNRTPCNANKPNQLDNQKNNNTQTTESPSTTETTDIVDKGPVVPNQPNFVSGWESYANITSTSTTTTEESYQETTQPTTSTSTTTTTTTTEKPYQETTSTTEQSQTPSLPNGSSSQPNPAPSSETNAYPPHLPNQKPNGYPNNNLAGTSGTFTNQQYPQYQQPSYPVPPPDNNYLLPLGPPSQFNGYPNQTSVYPQATYPSDNYQIHTIYPGSPNYAPQPFNPPAASRPIPPNYQGYPNNLPHPQPPAPPQEGYLPSQSNQWSTTTYPNEWEAKPGQTPPPAHPAEPLSART